MCLFLGDDIVIDFKNNFVIAAVRDKEGIEEAEKSNVLVIFDLSPNVLTLKKRVEAVHNENKKIFIHIDLAEGIGKDKAGIEFAKNMGVDGIISTRSNLIKLASDAGLLTVQRFFLIDSHSVDTTIDALKNSKADMIEVMPGVVPKVIDSLKNKVSQPIIAGGLIDKNEEIDEALQAGASAISTGKREFWD